MATVVPYWIQNDYWAPDRDQVLADPSRWGAGPQGERPDAPGVGARPIYTHNPSGPQPGRQPYGDYRDFDPGGIYYNTDPTGGTPQAPGGAPPTAPAYRTDWGGGDPAQQQRQIGDARRGRAPLGFQQGKWGNTNWNTTKYRAGTILAGGGTIADVLADPLFQGWTAEGTDKIKSPDGNIYDLYYDFGGPQQRVQYTQTGWGPNSDPRLRDNIRGNYRTGRGGPGGGGPGGGGFMPTDVAQGGYGPDPRTDGIPGNARQARGAWNGPPGDPGSYRSSYTSQFSDPSTQQYEGYLTTQINALEAQRAAQARAQGGFRDQQAAAQQSTDRLLKFLRERAGELQGPAYTGTEAEVLRTQLLDPIERDRTAANQRALQSIGARGLEPTSGIALQLQNEVNQGFDQRRAAAQGNLAYRTINEQRSREQEAQALMGMIPQIQRAAASGDLQFLQMLDDALNRPRQQGLNLSQILYRLPAQAQTDALAAMGMGPGADSIFQQALQMYGAQQGASQQNLGWYHMLGQILPYLLGGGGY